MNGREPILAVAFFRSAAGNEPVRDWIKSLPREERRILVKTSRRSNSAGPWACHSSGNSTRVCGKFVVAYLNGWLALSLRLAKAEWCFYMPSSKVTEDSAGGFATGEDAIASAKV
jgi:hypothetical protein